MTDIVTEIETKRFRDAYGKLYRAYLSARLDDRDRVDVSLTPDELRALIMAHAHLMDMAIDAD